MHRHANGLAKVAFVALVVTPTAAAGPLLDLRSSGVSSAQPGRSTTFVLEATNSGTVPIELAGMRLGLQILPQGLATGTATITSIGVSPTLSPWIDPLLAGPTVETLLNGPVNGTSTYYAVSIAEKLIESVGTILPGATVNLAAITIQASDDTVGLWNLYAVNEADEFGFVTSDYLTPSFDTYQFTTLVAPAYPAAGATFTLHDVQYVPEPSAALLCALGTAAVSSVSGLRKIHVRRCARRRTAPRPAAGC